MILFYTELFHEGPIFYNTMAITDTRNNAKLIQVTVTKHRTLFLAL